MPVATPKFGMGSPVLRLEDPTFITGKGRYTDDIAPAGTLHGYVLRSPIANARFAIRSVEAARAAPGVHIVLTGADIAHLGDLRAATPKPRAGDPPVHKREIPILCRDHVHYVGDAVAFVVADTRALAQDAADLIEVDYEGLDAVARTEHALDPGAPVVWPEFGTNRAFTYRHGDREKTDAAFARAARITRIEFRNNRLISNYIEQRSAFAEWKADEDRFVLTACSQGVHSVQKILSRVFKIEKKQLRVVTPDVGGGFCTKIFVYLEYALVMEAAMRVGRPVKWTSDRTEHFLTDAQGRDNIAVARMAMDEEGRFLAMKVDLTANMGAYLSQYGAEIPYTGATMSPGVYDIPVLDVEIAGVYTNTCPVDPYRGAGRPAAAISGRETGRRLRPRYRPRPRRDTPSQLHSARSISLSHGHRSPLRRRRVRRPHDAGHGARGLGRLRGAVGRIPQVGQDQGDRPCDIHRGLCLSGL